MKLSTLAILMGLFVAGVNAAGVWKPAAFMAAARRFPRNLPIGVALMLLATGWFVYYLSLEEVSDFTNFKNVLYFLFIGVGVGSCLFVHDFLAVRGLAVLFLLLAKLMVDTGRPMLGYTPWVLLMQTWAYVLVLAGMWLTVSPWRYRDFLNWTTAGEQRTRLHCGVRLGFGVLVLVLGLTAFRAAEKQAALSPHAGHTPAIQACSSGLV